MNSGSNIAKTTSPTTDKLPPVSTITSPTAGTTVVIGTTVNITGTASDTGGGSVAGVDVSVDGGASWNRATGTSAWSYNWTPTAPGPAPIRSRAVDDSGNQQNPPTEITVTVISPPQVASVTPAPGATNVSIGAAPTATFSKPLDPASINASTVLLRDAANNQVPSTLSYRASDFTVTLTPQQLLKLGQTYTVTLKGGSAAPNITDGAGTPLPSDYAWSFTTKPLLPVTIWAPTAKPSNPISNDTDAVELGLKFRSDSDGLITGVRFYKGGAANGGEHMGHLWNSAGTLLGSVTFADETKSGWQQALFENPIPIAANTTYVVSYFAPQGHYAADLDYFASSGVDNGPLHALSNAVAGGNGVFHYGPTGGFPTDSFRSANYWVDVVFIDSGPLPPQVVLATPTPGATNVSIDIAPTAMLSKPLDPTSLNASTIQLRDAANNPVPSTISYRASDFTVTLTPQLLLQMGQTYTVILKGGPAAPHITDVSGTPLPSDYAWSFTTPPPLPILVITSSGNKFTKYYQEILLAEGFNNFTAIEVTKVTDALLAQFDVAILGEMPLTSSQVSTLSNWVGSGGNLIAMRPDKQLASLLGIGDAAAVRTDAYLLVNTAQAPGAGIVNQTIQYHGTADLYTLAGATQVATIYSGPSQATSNPGVTLRSVGTNGGQAAAFSFDLARSIVYTRQGNPAWAGLERDGRPDAIRSSDLFFPDYVNLDKAAIPQADELQRLLGNMILSMNMDRRPLPRFWYLPNMKKAVLLMTGDDHGTPDGTRTLFDLLVAESAPGCSVGNWECYRATSWLYTESGLTNSQALAYHNQGFEMGAHVTTNCANWTPQTLEDFFANDLSSFAAKYTNLPAQKTNRTHCVAWSDWATQPKVEFNHGIRLDENYYYWPPEWVQDRPGFMTGSGFPMRYADLDGTVIDVYQAATHLVNENGVTYPKGINSMLDKALGPEGYYGVFGTHYDYSDSFATQLLNSAKARNVSLISARQLLTWLDGRNTSSLGNPMWNGTQLAFSITVGAGANNLFAMVPNQTSGGHLRLLTIDGTRTYFVVETIKGRSYAMFPAANGIAVATYAP